MIAGWRGWPRSAVGRLGFGGMLGLLLVGIAVLAAGAIGLAWLGERQFEPPQMRLPPPLVARIGAIATLVEEAPDDRALELVARATSSRDFRVIVAPRAPPGAVELEPPWVGADSRLAGALAERLGGRDVAIRLLHRSTGEDGERRRPSFEVVVGVAPDRWVSMRIGRDAFEPPPPGRFLLTIAVVLGVVIVVALLLARSVAAPVRSLARAADRLGRDLNAPALPESGPRELRAAARAFNRMQARLRSYIDDRTRMLAAISHDLRTVLTRLRLRVELIEDDEVRTRTERDIDEMQQMLEATLNFARDDAAREPKAEVDLALLVRDACAAFAEGGAAVAYAGPDALRQPVRPVAMRRMIDNLIDNAVKYGGGAEVGLATQGQGIVLTVADRGPGIPAELQERVFEPFYRIEGSRSRETGGSGLGLAVARSVARSHGGDITLRLRPGGGTVAEVVLPVEPA